MFTKILIANRGEIACRIIRTCCRLGIRTVAVYSDADASALHVRLADETCHIGESSPAASYLRGERLLEAAQKHKTQAVHPGYGFLSENAGFAHKCAESGIVFIGPSPEAITQMGAKDQAKSVMAKAGVPVVPGYHGSKQNPQILQTEAEKIGYPLMIKAVLGGGGKGMRVVRNVADFPEALQSAQNEARNAFGDDKVLLECFINGPRHIEFQVFGDRHGNVIHLFERECSLQRRHQKIIEESPSPFLDDALRTRMAEAAVSAAKVLKYAGAGTVEFIVGDDRSFYFMEMNTRLQVEHPVTEMISGLDLVEWQLRVAAGEKLPLKQKNITQNGHAIEARIYAENPETGFLPDIGKLHRLAFPAEIRTGRSGGNRKLSTRIDTGVEQGDEISIHYDPMIAKLIVHAVADVPAESRKQAIAAMSSALARTGVLGVANNLSFLQAIVQHSEFAAGTTDTLFVDSQLETLLATTQFAPDVPAPATWVYWATAISCLLEDLEQAKIQAQNSPDPSSPWNRFDNWRIGGAEPHRILLQNAQSKESEESEPYTEVRIFEEPETSESKRALHKTFRIVKPETPMTEKEEISVTVSRHGDFLDLTWNEVSGTSERHRRSFRFLILHHGAQRLAVYEQGRALFTRLNPVRLALAFEQENENNDDHRKARFVRLASAPMPGNVIRVLVESGTEVLCGQPLLVIEAMKMEHTIVAPADGLVEQVLYRPGDLVQTGAKLVEFSSKSFQAADGK